MSINVDIDNFDPSKDDFDWWWEEMGSPVVTDIEDAKDIARVAWQAAYDFYVGE
jgi:hypothetical protein